MLQKQENKQHQDLIYKSHCAREEQERKFELDMQVIKTEYKNIKSLHIGYVLKCKNKNQLIQALVKHLLVEESFCSAQAGIQKNTASLDCLQKYHELYYILLCMKHPCLDWERSFSLQTLVKNYDQDMETLNKTQKQQVEKAEQNQTVDMKNAAKRLKMDQVGHWWKHTLVIWRASQSYPATFYCN